MGQPTALSLEWTGVASLVSPFPSQTYSPARTVSLRLGPNEDPILTPGLFADLDDRVKLGVRSSAGIAYVDLELIGGRRTT